MVIAITTELIKMGRIIINYWEKINFEDFIVKTLLGKKTYTSRKYLYHFKNAKLINKGIYGEIYKARLKGLHDQLVSENELEYRPIQLDELEEYCRFCIFSDHTIAMTSKARFNSDEFIKIFAQLSALNSPKLAQIEIKYRRDDYDVFSIIDSFNKMIAVEIKKLRKSNPSPKPTFEKIEAFLKKEQTDEYSAEFKSDEASDVGLSRRHDSHIMSAISLSDAGYGESRIVGIKDGELIIINTKDKVIQGFIDKANKDDSGRFFDAILSKFGKHINLK